MRIIASLFLALALAGCGWFDNLIIKQDPTAEAIKSIKLDLDPLPPLDLEPFLPEGQPIYIKRPGPGTKFEVDLSWLEKHEKLLIELQSRINLHIQRDAINKKLLEDTKKLGTKK